MDKLNQPIRPKRPNGEDKLRTQSNLNRNLLGWVRQFLSEESGQTTTEYVLLLAVVAFVVVKLKTFLSQKLEGLLGSAFQNAQNNLNGE